MLSPNPRNSRKHSKARAREYVWQTCAGISGRGIASVLIMHGDDHGVVLPPKIAPTQIIIIPIPYKGQTETVNKECLKVVTELKNNGFRAEVDLRENITPGSKYFDWELRGVPIRIEIGPRDMEKGGVTVARRDTLEKQTCRQKEFDFLNRLTEKMTADLKQRA